MIITLAGRRIDAADAEVSRFAPSMKEEVRARLLRLFQERRATGITCSAACGADLLALDAAGQLGLRRRIVLPFSADEFRNTSVTDRSEPTWWGALYDRTLETLAADDLIVLESKTKDTAAYVATNEVILDEALRLAETKDHLRPHATDFAVPVLAVVVWEGKRRSGNDITAGFGDAAAERGIEVVYLSTRL